MFDSLAWCSCRKSSGLGMAAIQLAKALGGKVMTTVKAYFDVASRPCRMGDEE